MPDRPLGCRRCGSTELVLRETILAHAEYGDGLAISEDGQIVAHGEGIFTQGDPVPKLTRIECQGCGHDWHPRRTFAGAV